jgi:hypothetical protein
VTNQQHLAVLSGELEARLDEICAQVDVLTRRELPALWDRRDAGLEHALARGVRDHVAGAVRELGRGRAPLAELSADARREAEAAARARVPVEDLVATRRLAHAALWEACVEEISASELTGAARADLMKTASRFLFAHAGSALPLLRAAHERARTAPVEDRDRRREMLVGELLEGLPVDTADLGYDLRARHVGAVAWGAAPAAALQALAAGLGARERLLVADGDCARAWLAVPAGPCEPSLVLPAGTSCAVGEPAEGPEGFRLTHRQAHSAYRVGVRGPLGSLTRYRDVALVALATADPTAAADFVAHWLGPLAEDDPRTAVLRTTLSTYFAAGQNALAAAAQLGVNDRTVGYRLRRIEERVLGVPIAERRDELALALRLHALAARG